MEIYVAVAGVLLFTGVGFQRGWLREVVTLGGLLLAWVIDLVLGPPILGLVNQLGLMIRFTLAGGFDSSTPAALLQHLRQDPLINPARPGVFLGLLFLALSALSYYAASRWIAGATTSTSRILGALVALGNGFALMYHAFGYLVPMTPGGPADFAVVRQLADALGDYLLTVLLLGVILTIGIALLSSGRIGRRPAPPRSGRPARVRAPSA